LFSLKTVGNTGKSASSAANQCVKLCIISHVKLEHVIYHMWSFTCEIMCFTCEFETCDFSLVKLRVSHVNLEHVKHIISHVKLNMWKIVHMFQIHMWDFTHVKSCGIFVRDYRFHWHSDWEDISGWLNEYEYAK
jgi:hypothetical protein